VKKIFKVNLTRQAQEDLDQVVSYISANNPGNAGKFIGELEEKILSLATFPERAGLIPENQFLGTGYRHLLHERYRVIYRREDDTVFVLRVIHGAKLLEL